MATRTYGRAAMTAAGLAVLFVAGSAQAQDYEIRGCRPNVEIGTCCPNLYEFAPGSVLISNGRTCRLDTARNRDVTTTGSIATRGLLDVFGLGAVRGNGTVVTGTNGSVVIGGQTGTGQQNPGSQNPGSQAGQNGGHGKGNGKDKAHDNAGLGNGPEVAAGDINTGPKTDPDNPGHGGSRDFGGDNGGDKGGGDKGGGKGKDK